MPWGILAISSWAPTWCISIKSHKLLRNRAMSSEMWIDRLISMESTLFAISLRILVAFSCNIICYRELCSLWARFELSLQSTRWFISIKSHKLLGNRVTSREMKIQPLISMKSMLFTINLCILIAVFYNIVCFWKPLMCSSTLSRLCWAPTSSVTWFMSIESHKLLWDRASSSEMLVGWDISVETPCLWITSCIFIVSFSIYATMESPLYVWLHRLSLFWPPASEGEHIRTSKKSWYTPR